MYTQSKRERTLMNKEKILIVFTAIGTVLSQALGGVDTLLKVMGSLIVLDVVVGTVSAMIHGLTNSKVGWKGLLRKSFYLVIVYIGVSLDKVTGQSMFRNLTVMYVICIETISLLEHMDRSDIRYPQFIKDFLNRIMGEIDKGKLPSDWKPVSGTYESEYIKNDIQATSDMYEVIKEQVKEPKEPI